MSWENTVQIVDLLLGSVLIAKLLVSGLYRVYRVFWIFLIADLLGSYAWVLTRIGPLKPDYRILWLCSSLPVWYLSLSVVYSHMKKILKNLPGLAGLSRNVLNAACISAIALGLISALVEYGAWGLWDTSKLAICLATGGIIFDRMVSSIALFVFLAMLSFLLWFPVSVPRNVASLTAGLLLYFASKTALLLARGAWSPDSVRLVSFWITIVSSACFAFWIFQITPAGENAPSPLRLPRRKIDKERLVRQLEILDQSLVQAARR